MKLFAGHIGGMCYIIYVQTDININVQQIGVIMTLVQSLSNHISNIKLETTDVPIPEKAGLLIEVLKALNPDTQHSSDNFVYIGHRAEHLPVFENSETFWLSPMKIMSLEQYGSCSSRNEELLKTWIFLYGFKKEIQVQQLGNGWCKVM